MSSAQDRFDPDRRKQNRRAARLRGRSPGCEAPCCPGCWPENGEGLPCWPCYRDRDELPAVPQHSC